MAVFKHTFIFEKFEDPTGHPTCALDFPNDQVCRFLGVTGMCGQQDVCLFPVDGGEPARVHRKDGNGFIQPHPNCPFWSKNHD